MPANQKAGSPKLCGELAAWWPLLSAPNEYAEEAATYQRILLETSELASRSLLELGSYKVRHPVPDNGLHEMSGTGVPDLRLLRESDGSMHVEWDRHLEGLFARQDWLRLLAEVGFRPKVVPLEHSGLEPGVHELFMGSK